ncbi:hypothetical protein [Bacteroides uniformis]|nr:hypothetical protein [Bacteroides uniformis]MDC1890051.1 hypothetical protein [Bacteroides uniformis]
MNPNVSSPEIRKTNTRAASLFLALFLICKNKRLESVIELSAGSAIT